MGAVLRWAGFILLSLLSACGGGGGGGGGSSPPPPPAKGLSINLSTPASFSAAQLAVQSCPDIPNTAPSVIIEGPPGFQTRELKLSENLGDVPAGDYKVTARDYCVLHSGGKRIFASAVLGSPVRFVAGGSAAINVTWTESCLKGVATTIAADFESANASAYGDNPSGGGGDSGSSGGADGGGGEGKFRNAEISVYTASNPRTPIGKATVDDKLGLVSFNLCADTKGPIRFAVRGKPGNVSLYFDESINAYRTFFETDELNAVIPEFKGKNVGITLLTEAAYQSVTDNGALPDGWTDAAKVSKANEDVRAEVNRMLTNGTLVSTKASTGMQIEDITRLPWLIDDQTPTGTIAGQPNGVYGTVIAGLGRQASLFRGEAPSSSLQADTRPSRTLSKQLAADLSDGKLDYVAKNGRSVLLEPGEVAASNANLAERATYVPGHVAEMVNTGISRVADAKGNKDSLTARALRFVQVKFFQVDSNPIDNNVPIALLTADGQVLFWASRDQPLTTVLGTGYRQLYSHSILLGSTANGDVYRDPVISFSPRPATVGTLPSIITPYANATKIVSSSVSNISAFPVLIRKRDGLPYTGTFGASVSGGASIIDVLLADSSRFGDVIDIAMTTGSTADAASYFALRSNGDVYAWGRNFSSQTLGLGDQQPNDVPNPRQITTLRNIASIAGRAGGAFAVDRDGAVWEWGTFGDTSTVGAVFVPQRSTPLSSFGPIAQVACVAALQCLAVTKNGRAIVWGNYPGIFSPSIAPVAVTSFPRDRKVIYIGGSFVNVYGLLDNGLIFVFTTNSPATQAVCLDPIARRSDFCSNF